MTSLLSWLSAQAILPVWTNIGAESCLRHTTFPSPLASDQDPLIDAKTSGPRYLDIDTWLMITSRTELDWSYNHKTSSSIIEDPHTEDSLCSTAIGDGNRYQLQTPIQLPQHLGLRHMTLVSRHLRSGFNVIPDLDYEYNLCSIAEHYTTRLHRNTSF